MRFRNLDEAMGSRAAAIPLWLAASSAVVIESDTYRYACGVLALLGLRFYLAQSPRPAIRWPAWLCMAWAAYAFLIFLVMFVFLPGHPIGESEFLYCFPMFFPVLGMAFERHWHWMEEITASFFGVALAMLLVTTHYGAVAAGEAVSPLIQNNQIHGAVCCGILFIGALFWLYHYLTTASPRRWIAIFCFISAPLIMLLSIFCIYGAKSKGVWLALAITLPVVAGLIVRRLQARRGMNIFALAIAALFVGAYAVRANIEQVAGPTVTAAVGMIENAGRRGNMAAAVDQAIGSQATPISMDERLQLWWNASQLISASPALGWGNLWLDRWHQSRFGGIRYDLMHNGYFEILVRYGLFGAAILATILWSLVCGVFRTYRQGLIAPGVWHAYLTILLFFALTLLSNSNNRLAIGESLALVSSAFAFGCRLRLMSFHRQ